MNDFRADVGRSVRGKLMRLVLVTTAIAVSVAAGAMLAYDLSVYRGSWAAELSNQAALLAVSVSPALEFDDHDTAERNLAAMRVRPRVAIAALYSANGYLYASYVRDPKVIVPARAPPHGERISGDRVELSTPVEINGISQGTIYLLARYGVATRLRAYATIFVLVMSISLVVTYFLSTRLQRAITEPLEAMTDVARQIVNKRDYSLRAASTTDDEIGIVVLAFNRMLDEIEARAAASAAAEAALRVADRRKDEFLATLAHELRNPLAPIRHAVRLLDGAAANPEQQQYGRAVIGRQVQRMALLLDDLLDVSRITRGRLTLKMIEVGLSSVLDAAIEVALPMINAKSQILSVDSVQQPLFVRCDPLRLSQSLSNLLTNASKYTDQRGTISLKVGLSQEELSFIVKDSGIGLDPAAIPGLFEIFSQVDAAIDRAEGGLGIGLALVKGLVGLHGGRVEVASGGAGMGSEFSIHLPRALVSMHPPAAPAAPAPEHRDDSTARCKIVLADDNADAVESMAMVLELSGYEVCVAHTGREALRLAELHRPAVMLLDIGMPDLNGYEVAREIRAQPWGRTIYLMAITGWGQSADKDRANAAGFDQHLTKPVDLDAVEKLIAEFLGRRMTA